MSLFAWIDSKVQKMKWYDISLTKLSVAGFILFVAKLWSPILSLDWYWYLIIGIVAAIGPMSKVFSK